MGTKIAITSSFFFGLEVDFYHRLYRNTRRVVLDHFSRSWASFLGKLWGEMVSTIPPVATGRVYTPLCSPSQGWKGPPMEGGSSLGLGGSEIYMGFSIHNI
jgi:hypothetical protein